MVPNQCAGQHHFVDMFLLCLMALALKESVFFLSEIPFMNSPVPFYKICYLN